MLQGDAQFWHATRLPLLRRVNQGRAFMSVLALSFEQTHYSIINLVYVRCCWSVEPTMKLLDCPNA